MLGTIIRKEILENLYSYRFTVLSLLTVILVLTSVFVMYRDYQLRQDNYSLLQPGPGQAVAIIPPAPLSIFARGLDQSLGRSYEFSEIGISVGKAQQSANDLFRLFATPDLVYIIKVVMALCAILFAFNLVSGEKEAGTLRLGLSNSLGRPLLLVGKWIGGFTGLAVPFLLAILLAAALVSLAPGVQIRASDWLRLGLILAGALLYLAVFFSLGLLVSALVSRSASALVISLFLWAVMVFVIPNLGSILARQVAPLPSVQQLELVKEQIWIKEVFELIQSANQGQITAQRSMDKTMQALERIDTDNDKQIWDFRQRLDHLLALTTRLTRFSPPVAFSLLATDLAGTGLDEDRRLKLAVLEYKDTVRKLQFPPREEKVSFPAFSFSRRGLGEILESGGLTDLAVLVFSVLFCFTAAYVVFLRYDVR
jgi:ABC-type transport system involved in multi-copper enzyme maturation permease subunit